MSVLGKASSGLSFISLVMTTSALQVHLVRDDVPGAEESAQGGQEAEGLSSGR